MEQEEVTRPRVKLNEEEVLLIILSKLRKPELIEDGKLCLEGSSLLRICGKIKEHSKREELTLEKISIVLGCSEWRKENEAQLFSQSVTSSITNPKTNVTTKIITGVTKFIIDVNKLKEKYPDLLKLD